MTRREHNLMKAVLSGLIYEHNKTDWLNIASNFEVK